MGRTLNIASGGLLQTGGLSSLNIASRGLLQAGLGASISKTASDLFSCVLVESGEPVWIVYVPGSDTWRVALASDHELVSSIKTQNLRLNIPAEWHEPVPTKMWQPLGNPVVYDD